MLQITATDAKARFAELLRAVEAGETVEITRHGKAVARLAPSNGAVVGAQPAWMERFEQHLASREPTGMTREEILALRHEGRKY